jgi:hypothetical protein
MTARFDTGYGTSHRVPYKKKHPCVVLGRAFGSLRSASIFRNRAPHPNERTQKEAEPGGGFFFLKTGKEKEKNPQMRNEQRAALLRRADAHMRRGDAHARMHFGAHLMVPVAEAAAQLTPFLASAGSVALGLGAGILSTNVDVWPVVKQTVGAVGKFFIPSAVHANRTRVLKKIHGDDDFHHGVAKSEPHGVVIRTV